MLRFALCLLLAASAFAQPLKRPLPLKHPVQDKLFYVLSAMENTPAPFRSSTALAQLATNKQAALSKAAKTCELDIKCMASALKWSDAEIEAAATALAPLATSVDPSLRDSGLFVRYQGSLLVPAWRDAAKALNKLIDVYGLGEPGRSAAIDSIAVDVKGAYWPRLMHVMLLMLEEQAKPGDLFFEPTLHFALHLMQASRRDEAGRHEPMHLGENKAALDRIPTIAWAKYPYTVIVVPGAGSDVPGVRISPAGHLRSEIAAKRYREGKAPFILVSGGYVHPNQTPFNEAIEMKRVLMENYAIPANAILIDPHARHTTTNLRNAARILYRYGFPFDKTGLITTDLYQSQYIESKIFTDRCEKELGYQPHKALKRLNPFDLEWLPTLDSLQADSTDPLDP
jgi:hypothetical protein